jgi:3-(methylsulfanyl)propanoyl-CoA dehydrogenase
MIYEGTNGIQALDLVGRKLSKDNGRALQAFFAEVAAFTEDHRHDADVSALTSSLGVALDDLRSATQWFMQNALGRPDNAGAGAADYLQLFGLVALGYMWCLIVDAARTGTDERINEKRIVGRFFMERMLPATATHLARIKAGAENTMALPVEAF